QEHAERLAGVAPAWPPWEGGAWAARPQTHERLSSSGGRARTGGLFLMRETLSPLSYTGDREGSQSRRWGSNPHPSLYENGAQPVELRRQSRKRESNPRRTAHEAVLEPPGPFRSDPGWIRTSVLHDVNVASTPLLHEINPVGPAGIEPAWNRVSDGRLATRHT